METLQEESPQRRVAMFDDFAAATPEGNLIQVFDAAGRRIYPSLEQPATDFPWPAWSIANGKQYTRTYYGGRLYRVLLESTNIGPEQFRILVAGQLEDNWVLLHRFAIGLVWATPALLVISALCGYFLSFHSTVTSAGYCGWTCYDEPT